MIRLIVDMKTGAIVELHSDVYLVEMDTCDYVEDTDVYTATDRHGVKLSPIIDQVFRDVDESD